MTNSTTILPSHGAQLSAVETPDDVQAPTTGILTRGAADKDYQLAEYGRLSDEIGTRIQLGIQFFDRLLTVAEKCAAVAGIFLTLAGLMISVGPHVISSAQTLVLLLAVLCSAAAVALLCCPILLAFLAGLVAENDLRVGQINYHLRYEHEEPYLPRGWEKIRHGLFQARPWFLKKSDRDAQYHELAGRQGLKVLSMRGLFATVQMLFLVAGSICACLGLINYSHPLLIILLSLFWLVALGLTVLTWFTIEHRRHRSTEGDTQ